MIQNMRKITSIRVSCLILNLNSSFFFACFHSVKMNQHEIRNIAGFAIFLMTILLVDILALTFSKFKSLNRYIMFKIHECMYKPIITYN